MEFWECCNGRQLRLLKKGCSWVIKKVKETDTIERVSCDRKD